MKWANRGEIRPSSLEGKIAPNHLNDIASGTNLVKCRL